MKEKNLNEKQYNERYKFLYNVFSLLSNKKKYKRKRYEQ